MTPAEAGRIDGAGRPHRTSLENYPNHLPTLMGLTWVQIRSQTTNEQTKHNLRAIVMQAGEPAWREWAERELIRLEQ
tara:strand:- start:1099 stop:1329 length:231 start_codon:yes stop_codon:yes gene_type:complete